MNTRVTGGTSEGRGGRRQYLRQIWQPQSDHSIVMGNGPSDAWPMDYQVRAYNCGGQAIGMAQDCQLGDA